MGQNVNVIYIGDDEQMFVTRTFYSKVTGKPTRQETRDQDGRLQAPPDDTPSEVRFDSHGRPTDMIWHSHNLEHRQGAPSAVVLYPETGQTMCEQFRRNGQPVPAEQGPFRVFYSEDGQVVREIAAREQDRIPEETIVWEQNQLEP